MGEIAIEITNAQGRRFRARIVPTGGRYGLDWKLTHKGLMPMVEFYDLHFPDKFGERGQFVSRYFADTLLAGAAGAGLALDFGNPSWNLDGATMDRVRLWVATSTHKE